MPCRDGRDNDTTDYSSMNRELQADNQRLEQRNDRLAQMLCHTLGECAHLKGVEERLSADTKE